MRNFHRENPDNFLIFQAHILKREWCPIMTMLRGKTQCALHACSSEWIDFLNSESELIAGGTEGALHGKHLVSDHRGLMRTVDFISDGKSTEHPFQRGGETWHFKYKFAYNLGDEAEWKEEESQEDTAAARRERLQTGTTTWHLMKKNGWMMSHISGAAPRTYWQVSCLYISVSFSEVRRYPFYQEYKKL